jgi:hypothetical protein
LVEQINARGFTVGLVPDASSLGGADGVTRFSTSSVLVRQDTAPAEQVKTLAHELGHVLMHSAQATQCRGVAEVEAESFAMIIAAAHGMEGMEYSVPYVASWASRVDDLDPVEVVQRTGHWVRSAALPVLEALQTAQVSDGFPLIGSTPTVQEPVTRVPYTQARATEVGASV